MLVQGRDYDTGFADGQRTHGRAVMVRSAAKPRVSNHGSLGPSFETPREGAAPQDDGVARGAGSF